MHLSAIDPKTEKDKHMYTDPSGTPPCTFSGDNIVDIRNTKEYKEKRKKWDNEQHSFFESNLQLIKEWKNEGYIRINASSYLGYEDFEPTERKEAKKRLQLLLKNDKGNISKRYSEKDRNLIDILTEMIIEWKWDTGKQPSSGSMNELREWLCKKIHPRK